MKLTPEAKKIQQAYYKAWRKKNPEKQKLYINKYWNKRAAEQLSTENEKKHHGV